MSDDPPRLPLWTIGHSTRSFEAFAALLQRERIERLVDVRRFPASRRHPQFESSALAASLAAIGIDYEHVLALGGRRRPSPESPNIAWRNESFRGYADYMMTEPFRSALDHVLESARHQRTTVMCSEAVPWRCHRTMIADAALARGVEVLHILDAKTAPHALTSFARVENGEVRYDGGQSDLFGARTA